MSTAPGSNERMDHHWRRLSLSNFGIHLSVGEGAAQSIGSNNRPAPAAARLTAPGGLNERAWTALVVALVSGFARGRRGPPKNQRKRALVNHLSLKSSRARGAGRVVSSVSRAPIPF